jgi:PAS domain S-box-containing protein
MTPKVNIIIDAENSSDLISASSLEQEQIIRQRKERLEFRNRQSKQSNDFLIYSNEVIYAWDLDGAIIYWNNGAEMLYGYNREEAVGCDSHVLLKTVQHRITGDIKSILVRDRAWNGEMEQTCKCGKKVITETRMQVILDEFGQQIVLEINRDITKRKRAEEAELESRAILEAALASMTDAVFISDAEGRFVDFNDAFSTFHKFRNKDECLKTLAEYPDVLDVFTADGKLAPLDSWAVPRALRGESVTNAEYILRRKDTGETWVGSYGFAPIRDKTGAIVGSVVAGRDITERKKDEERIQEQNAQLMQQNDLLRMQVSLLNLSNEAIFAWDLNGTITYWNIGAEKMYGYSSEEAVGCVSHDLLKTVHSSDMNNIKSILERDRVWNGEIEHTCKAGKKHIIETSHQVIFNKLGQPMVLETNRDITHRKQAEDDIVILNNQLVKINAVLEETNTVLEEEIQEHYDVEAKLIKAKEQAEAANTAKSQFLANMSHEIRTPMNGVMGMLQLLQMTELTKQQADYLKVSMTSSESLLKVINDILDYSKIEAGKFNVEKIRFNLLEFLDEIEIMFKPSVWKKGFALNRVIEDNVPHNLIGDSFRLRQVLSNIIGNAIKFTHKGRIDITVRMLEENNNEVKLEWAVQDTGIGLSQDNLKNIFNSFSQADSSTTRQYGGTGLGLSICKGLVENMQGGIWAESQEGEGSRFYFTCVLEKSEKDYPNLMRADCIEDSVKEDVLKLLIVEDDATSQMVMEELSRKKGWQVILTENGKEAVDAYRGYSFDAIVMDCQIPILDGYKATGVIRQIERHNGIHTPIIAMTAHALRGDREKCLESGMDDYLSKPIDADKFYATVEKWTINKQNR